MKPNYKKPLQAVLHGMNARLQKNMLLYFQNVCQGALVVVEEAKAEIDIVDVDSVIGQAVLNELLAKESQRPIIVLSRNSVDLEQIHFIEKPISLPKVLDTFNALRRIVDRKNSKKMRPEMTDAKVSVKVITNQTSSPPALENNLSNDSDITEAASTPRKVVIDTDEIKKVAKHRSIRPLNEKVFSSFLGMMIDIDVTNQQQLLAARYSPRDYYQGYVAATFRAARTKKRVLQLNSNWKPLLIFPHSNEVWLDADDKQLRAFAFMEMNKATGTKLTVSSMNLELTHIKKKLECFYDMDAFIWKLAIWTSRGRYPDIIDSKRPVLLLRWPNFTRTIITPHALRMTALLVNEPKTMLSISKGLQIKPQYVFIFVSGAYALGLIRQPMEKPNEVITRPAVISKKKKGLLNRILSRLRS